MAAAAKRKDIRDYFNENVELQSEIRKLSGNSTLARLLGGLGRQTLRYRYIVYEMVPEMIGISLRRNGEILKALQVRDAARVRQLTEHLILEAGQRMMKELPENRLSGDSLEKPPQFQLASEGRDDVNIHSDLGINGHRALRKSESHLSRRRSGSEHPS
jgi:ribosomal protein S13